MLENGETKSDAIRPVFNGFNAFGFQIGTTIADSPLPHGMAKGLT